MAKRKPHTLFEARRMRNKTRAEVADETGISESSLVRYETGQRAVPEMTARKLARFYGLSLSMDVAAVSRTVVKPG